MTSDDEEFYGHYYEYIAEDSKDTVRLNFSVITAHEIPFFLRNLLSLN